MQNPKEKIFIHIALKGKLLLRYEEGKLFVAFEKVRPL